MLRRSFFALVRHARHVRLTRAFSTNLERDIARTITATGPLSFAKYMELCLQHPTEGYYARASHASDTEIVGARGDFVTSPEISQHFGQLIAIWFLSLWQQRTPLPRLRIIELGPGRGTLAADVVQTFQSIPRVQGKLAAVDLVETSSMLAELQRSTLTERMNAATDVPVRWWTTFDDVPTSDDFSVVIAHEFFDALPFHIIEKTTSGWQEVLVDIAPSPQAKEHQYIVTPTPVHAGPRFRYVLSGPSLLATKLASVSPRYSSPTIPTGTRIEVSPRSYDLSRKIAQFISRDAEGRPSHGAALFVDYGDARFFSHSARGFQKHKLVDVFHEPGQTDLTSNVDFALLEEAVVGTVSVQGPINQASFLARMGLRMRLEQTLAKTNDAADRTRILKAAGRLVDMGPAGMGGQYQFMGLSTMQDGTEVYPFVQETKSAS